MVKRNSGTSKGNGNAILSGRVGRSSTRVAAETANLRLKEMVPEPKLYSSTTKVTVKAVKPGGGVTRNKNAKVAAKLVSTLKKAQKSRKSATNGKPKVEVVKRRNGLKLVTPKGKGGKWIAPNYTDKEWFAKEMSQCQGCSKTFKSSAKATACIASHDLVRCYFCFKTCENTGDLFDHFRACHVKQTGKRRVVEDTLLCPFCTESIPFKDVSCHVITHHVP